MARTVRKVELHFCDRDAYGKQRLATETPGRTRSRIATTSWICARNTPSQLFDRDISKWTMLSEEIENPFDNAARPKEFPTFFTEERKLEARRINELADQVKAGSGIKEFAERRAAEIEAQDRKSEEDRARRAIPGAGDELPSHRPRPGTYV